MMNTIPLKEAIETGPWFECYLKWFAEGHNIFRLKVMAFITFREAGIDTTALKELGDDGVLWAMKIEVEPAIFLSQSHCITLIDDDGFEFTPLRWIYEYHKPQNGLRLFSDWSENPTPPQEIKAAGAIAFLLPDQESNYYLTIRDGTIREA